MRIIDIMKFNVGTFIHDWFPRKTTVASGDAPKLRAALCKLGFHSPYYKYGPEKFHTWEEIKAGYRNPRIEHSGWHCRFCERRFRRRVIARGFNPSFLHLAMTWVQRI